jgi:beta-xylosidase
MIYATYNGLSVFEADRPEGPYAAVSGGLVAEGYDPGVFVDDEGGCIWSAAPARSAELGADGKTVINPSVSTYAGWNEGPELFKRAPYYYVTWSSNGTNGAPTESSTRRVR